MYPSIVKDIVTIIRKHTNTERIYLYGSYASGNEDQSSDIDIAYDDANFKKNYLIEDDIEKLETLKKIEIKNLAFTDERFQNRVKDTGKVLFSATKELRAEDGLYNFTKALEKYQKSVEQKERFYEDGYGDVYLEVLVKRFEFTYEMCWKALKRLLDYRGVKSTYPRMVFKDAFAQGLIKDETIWLDMIEQRNLTSHIYNEIEASIMLEKAEKYLQAFINCQKEIAFELKIGNQSEENLT